MLTAGLVLCDFDSIYVLSLCWLLSLIQVTLPALDKGFRENDQLLPLLSKWPYSSLGGLLLEVLF